MAISLIKISPKLSIQNLATVLTDNFNIIEESVNDVISIVNIGTGKFDNSGYGTDNNIKTGNIEAIGTNGVSITLGNLSLAIGRVIMSGASSRIEIGANVKFERITLNLSSGTIDTIDLSGTSGALSGTGPVGPVHMPRLDNATILDIQTPIPGQVVWDDTNSKLKLYDGISWVDLN